VETNLSVGADLFLVFHPIGCHFCKLHFTNTRNCCRCHFLNN
jgi:hypothetical protein